MKEYKVTWTTKFIRTIEAESKEEAEAISEDMGTITCDDVEELKPMRAKLIKPA